MICWKKSSKKHQEHMNTLKYRIEKIKARGDKISRGISANNPQPKIENVENDV